MTYKEIVIKLDVDETRSHQLLRVLRALGVRFHNDLPPVTVDQCKIANVGLEWIDLLLCKNADYGSTVFLSPRLAPELPADAAIRTRMSDKIDRLETLLKNGTSQVRESVEDTVRDLGAYCLLWLVNTEINRKQKFEVDGTPEVSTGNLNEKKDKTWMDQAIEYAEEHGHFKK